MDASPSKSSSTELSPKDFKIIAELAYDRWGLKIQDSKRTLVQNRLQALSRELKMGGLDALLQRIFAAKSSDKLLQLFDALSTNETSFFRHPDHFVWLKEFLRERSGASQAVKIWSAGCSMGCEPYTISMVVEELSKQTQIKAKILATDLSKSVLETASLGIYPKKYLHGLDPKIVESNFQMVMAGNREMCQVKANIRRNVSFGMVNLLGEWKMRSGFDAIFCRNVMIYFDDDTRYKVIDRFADMLVPGGALIMGNAENIPRTNPKLKRADSVSLIRTDAA